MLGTALASLAVEAVSVFGLLQDHPMKVYSVIWEFTCDECDGIWFCATRDYDTRPVPPAHPLHDGAWRNPPKRRKP